MCVAASWSRRWTRRLLGAFAASTGNKGVRFNTNEQPLFLLLQLLRRSRVHKLKHELGLYLRVQVIVLVVIIFIVVVAGFISVAAAGARR